MWIRVLPRGGQCGRLVIFGGDGVNEILFTGFDIYHECKKNYYGLK